MKKLNIAMVAACPFPGNRGTPSRILRMSEGLADLGHDVHVVTYHFGTDTPTRGISTHRIPKIIKYSNFDPGPTATKLAILDPLLFLKLLQVVKTEKVDLIHAHHFEGALVSYAVRALTGVRVIYDAHTTLEGELSAYNFWNPARVRKKMDYLVPNAADHIVAVSEELKDSLSEMGIPEHKISCIPTGVNPETFDGKDPTVIRRKYNLGNKKIVIYTGTLAEYQGIDLLLKAIRIMSTTRTKNDFFLLVVGNSNIKKYQRMCEDLSIGDKVIFAGEQPFEEVPYFLAAAYIAVIPRDNCPGIPQKLTNYMAAGKAIVCFKGSAKAIRHKENGLIVKNRDIPAMAQAITTLLNHEKLRVYLAKNAKTSIIGKYDWNSLCENLIDIYQKII